MDPEGSDRERLERALVLRHPVLVRQVFPAPAGAKRRLELGPVTLAVDLDAPRTVARELAAGDDEALFGEQVECLLACGSLRRRHVKPRRPEAHAASMKLSSTFFGPAF